MRKRLWGTLTLLVALCFALTACSVAPDGQTEDSDIGQLTSLFIQVRQSVLQCYPTAQITSVLQAEENGCFVDGECHYELYPTLTLTPNMYFDQGLLDELAALSAENGQVSTDGYLIFVADNILPAYYVTADGTVYISCSYQVDNTHFVCSAFKSQKLIAAYKDVLQRSVQECQRVWQMLYDMQYYIQGQLIVYNADEHFMEVYGSAESLDNYYGAQVMQIYLAEDEEPAVILDNQIFMHGYLVADGSSGSLNITFDSVQKSVNGNLLQGIISGTLADVRFYLDLLENRPPLTGTRTSFTLSSGRTCSVVLPDSWQTRYTASIFGEEIAFYYQDICQFGGQIFSLLFVPEGQDYTDFPDYEILMQTADGVYLLQYPTDVQFDGATEEQIEIYTQMSADVSAIAKTLAIDQ